MRDTTTVYGRQACVDTVRSRAMLDHFGVTYTFVDVEHDERFWSESERISGRRNVPVILLPDGSHLVEPSEDELAVRLQQAGLL